MKIACTLFVTLIALVNVVAGLKQAYSLFKNRISVCDGRIVESGLGQMEERHGGENKLMMYWPVVGFEYVVSGRRLKGDRISIATSRTSDRGTVEKRPRFYPEGRWLKVYYNPDDPSEAWLKNPRKHILTSLLVAFGMLVFGVAMGLMTWTFVP